MWINKLQCREKAGFFFLIATLHFTSIVKKEIINDYFTSQRSNSQHNKTSFILFLFKTRNLDLINQIYISIFHLPAEYQIL